MGRRNAVSQALSQRAAVKPQQKCFISYLIQLRISAGRAAYQRAASAKLCVKAFTAFNGTDLSIWIPDHPAAGVMSGMTPTWVGVPGSKFHVPGSRFSPAQPRVPCDKLALGFALSPSRSVEGFLLRSVFCVLRSGC